VTAGADHRRVVQEVTAALAPGWERQRTRIEEFVAPVREWMIRELAPKPAQTVLELAAGIGDTGLEAAAIVGERGQLISSDLAPEMVEAARRRGAELGLRNVDHRVVDAERIQLDADSVDAVICRFGFMLMADPAAALAETRRVLRPGGNLVLAVWGAPERNPWVTALITKLVELGHVPPPEPGGPDPFSMASAEHTRALVEGAGFATVRTENVPVQLPVTDVGDYLAYAADTAGPAGLVLRGLSEADRDKLALQLADAFAPFATAGAYQLPGVALAGIAR
jgi:ubiquinone/menaquinone biosynthesis C-methylase UbiE